MKLRMNKTIAVVNIGNHIDIAKGFLGKLNEPGFFDSYENKVEFGNDLNVWLQDTVSLLGRIFDDTSLVEEYKELNDLSINDDESWTNNKNRLRKNIDERVEWLSNLANRLDELPEQEEKQ